METVFERCAGLDVHKATVVACRRLPSAQEQGDGKSKRRRKKTDEREAGVRTFSTTTVGLLELHDWLADGKVTHVAMESTGVYWRPVHAVLEGAFEVLLVNAHHVKMVPGRKTDVKDCEWLANLLEHGLLRASFIPPPEIRDLRDLTRFRRVLVQERTRHTHRIAKTLEMANIKLGNVASDILGKSGRAMIEGLSRGTFDPEELAGLAQGNLRKKYEALRVALAGRMTPHYAFMLGQQLQVVDDLNRRIAEFDAKIEESLRPFDDAVARLETIPGVGTRTAQIVIAEIGVQMARFPTAGHLCSWAGLCPGNNSSAGKQKSGRTRKGDSWLKSALVEAAWAASRVRRTYLSALYWRLKARRGSKKAIVAVAHSILASIWHMLSRTLAYNDLGAGHFDLLNRERMKRHHLRRLAELGYTVAIDDAAGLAPPGEPVSP